MESPLQYVQSQNERHNNVMHQVVHALQSNKHTRLRTLTNAQLQNSNPHDKTIMQWLLQCTCTIIPCTYLACLRPYILHVFCAPNNNQLPLIPSLTNTIQFREFTWCHDRFHNTTIRETCDKYNPLIRPLTIVGWIINLLITITTGINETIHKYSLLALKHLKLPPSVIKKLIKQLIS